MKQLKKKTENTIINLTEGHFKHKSPGEREGSLQKESSKHSLHKNLKFLLLKIISKI